MTCADCKWKAWEKSVWGMVILYAVIILLVVYAHAARNMNPTNPTCGRTPCSHHKATP